MALVDVLAAAALAACFWEFYQSHGRALGVPLPPGPRPDPLISSESGPPLSFRNVNLLLSFRSMTPAKPPHLDHIH